LCRRKREILEGADIWSSGKAKPPLGDREWISDKFSEFLGQVSFFDETAATRKKRSQTPADSKKPHFKAMASPWIYTVREGRTPQSLSRPDFEDVSFGAALSMWMEVKRREPA
jgi:hypothetical protein